MPKDEMQGWIGRTLIGPDGEKIGKIDAIYDDEQTGQPEWLAVHTGLFGTKTSFVPLQGATPEGDDLRVEHPKDKVKDAPHVEPDGRLSEQEEARLYEHYGRTYDTSRPPAGDRPEADRTDDAMTRSEEKLDVSKVRRETGRARLRKWVDTEHVETKVPVRHEEARVVREPITDGNLDAAVSGPEISEDEHEVVLHEEEVVANTRVEPKERVRLETDEVVEDESVSADLRKEHIEVEGEAKGRKTRR